MKKLIMAPLFALVTIVSFGQSNQIKREDNYSFSFGLFTRQFGDLYMDMRTPKWGGIGWENYSREGSVYGRDYTGTIGINAATITYKDKRNGTTYSGWNGNGIYYITPSFKGFDLSIGRGTGTREVYEQFFDETYILSTSGNYHIQTSNQKFGYTILGLNKSIKISKAVELELKVMRKISSDESITTFGGGIRMNMPNF